MTRSSQLEESLGFVVPATRNGSGKARRSQGLKTPASRREEKPPAPAGYHWRSNGSGFELRKTVYLDGKRKQPYIAHLSKEAFQEMKRRHKGPALNEALAEWIEAREREKGIT